MSNVITFTALTYLHLCGQDGDGDEMRGNWWDGYKPWNPCNSSMDSGYCSHTYVQTKQYKLASFIFTAQVDVRQEGHPAWKNNWLKRWQERYMAGKTTSSNYLKTFPLHTISSSSSSIWKTKTERTTIVVEAVTTQLTSHKQCTVISAYARLIIQLPDCGRR